MEEYRIEVTSCCSAWNLGFACKAESCAYIHCCSFKNCRTLFHTSHRAIQHTPDPRCGKYLASLAGMNILYPDALQFDDRSSVEDTIAACEEYDIKPPSLNADRLEALLQKTEINKELQASIVRGWREGFDIGSKLDDINHFAAAPRVDEIQEEVLRTGLEAETKLKRMHGPLDKPLSDGRWFTNSWVSPYFVIPKHTPEGEPQKWRLIHHLSYHNSGDRRKSLNGQIDIAEYPTLFPTPETGAHLVF